MGVPCVQARVTELASSALSTFISRVAATIFNLTPASAQMGTAGALQVSCTAVQTCPALQQPAAASWPSNLPCKLLLPQKIRILVCRATCVSCCGSD